MKAGVRYARRYAAGTALVALAAALAALAVLLLKPVVVPGSTGGFDRAAASDAAEADDAAGGIDWDYWKSVNPDVVGWITVDGTAIDSPVVRAPADDRTKYLHTNVYGEYDACGTIYMDADCLDGWRSDAVVLFGHNTGMSTPSSFTDLTCYADPMWAELHSDAVHVLTPDGDAAACLDAVDVVDGAYAEKVTRFEDREEMGDYHAGRCMWADVDLGGAALEGGQGLLTLVTCADQDGSYDGRVLVMGRIGGEVR